MFRSWSELELDLQLASQVEKAEFASGETAGVNEAEDMSGVLFTMVGVRGGDQAGLRHGSQGKSQRASWIQNPTDDRSQEGPFMAATCERVPRVLFRLVRAPQRSNGSREYDPSGPRNRQRGRRDGLRIEQH
jgi:hypothetical protein